jgi:hypothetical protein
MLSSATTVLISNRLIAPSYACNPPYIPLKMDTVIDYDEVAGFFKNPPSLEPCPNFDNICALQKHMVKALLQLSCPQSAIHGWSGLAMDPAIYFLLEGVAFTIPADPGPTANFPKWSVPTAIKMIEATFDCEKNYFLSYKNITRACFRMLDGNVLAQFKVSNNAALTGWNSTMSIINILSQLQDSYGMPNVMTLFTNDTLFHSPMTAGNLPKMLFYRIEQCQGIQCIRKLPYSDEQIIANVVRILIQAHIFPLKEFDTWEAVTPKTYPALKMFIHVAYGRRLTAMALCSTSGQNRYAHQRIYNVMEAGLDDDTDSNTATTITQTAALTTATGGMTPSSGTAISAKVTAAINQLLANQTAFMSQMAAMTAQMAALSVVPPPAQHTCAFVPLIQHIAVPMQQPFAPVGMYHTGRGGWRVVRGRGHGRCHGSCSRTPFADAMRFAGAAPAMTTLIPYGRGLAQLPAASGVQQQHHNPDFSSIYKVHNNWNVCFRCGFDIEERHTSIMCPSKKWNHQDLFTRENAQQFIAAGYNPCTKGMHKTVLPSKRNT